MADKLLDPTLLDDAVKVGLSMPGYALLQWDFDAIQYARSSHQLPVDVIDLILAWRDASLKDRGLA